MTNPDGQEMLELPEVGKTYWFEYLCWEDDASQDAQLWYHSHQQCEVLSLSREDAYGVTKIERYDSAQPLIAKVRFSDGFEYDVFEDELLENREDFTEDDPPLPPHLR